MLGDQAWVGFYRQAPSNRCTVSSNTMVQRMALLWVGALFVVLFPGAQSDVVADEAYSKSIKPCFAIVAGHAMARCNTRPGCGSTPSRRC